MLPRQLEGAEHDASESTHEASGSSVGGIDHINVDQLRTALCAFLGIEEGGANTEFLNRYIQTFCAASAIMGEANTFGNILGQSEDEFHNTLQICRLISEQFEIEISTQQRLTVATDVQDDVVTIIPPAREAAINSLPFERVLPADRLNFQHDKTCCPICFEPLIEGLVLTRRTYHFVLGSGASVSQLVLFLNAYSLSPQSLVAICITRIALLLGCLGVARAQSVGTSFRRIWVPSTKKIATVA